MTTFVLKKYMPEEEKVEVTEPQEVNEKEETEKRLELIIHVDDSIATIIAKSLHETLKNKAIITELTDDNAPEVHPEDKVGQVISTESINKDPLKAFRSIEMDSIVYIANEGFKTKEEEWFLTNIENRASMVHYTVESFLRNVLRDFL